MRESDTDRAEITRHHGELDRLNGYELAGPRRGSLQCLLDLDSELAEQVEVQGRQAARAAALARTFAADPGRLRVPDWLTAAWPGPGLLVLEGILVVDVTVVGRVASELLGTGDLIQSISRECEELLCCQVQWRALAPVQLALLDGDFAKRVRFWPQISQALLRRAGRRTASLAVQRAIASHPRLEVRLALLLWHLAARWGKVEPGGVRLPVPLTHHLLGHMVGAERPSVTHALTRLAQAGLITGHAHEWHLHGRLEDQLEAMGDHSRHRADDVVMAVGTFGTA